MKCPRALALIVLCTLSPALVPGCAPDSGPSAPAEEVEPAVSWIISSSPAAADAGALRVGPDFYPLHLGNVWKYRAHVMLEVLEGENPGPEELVRTTKAEIVGSEDVFDRCYAVEERSITEDDAPEEVITAFIYRRQDAAGLYDVDVPLSGASDRPRRLAPDRIAPRFAAYLRDLERGDDWIAAATRIHERLQPARSVSLQSRRGAGPADGEYVRLWYPLRPGQSWVIIDDEFTMTATVERREILDLPVGRTPAWRVRIESTLFGPDDEIRFFYGREGYLGWRVVAYEQVVDEDGAVLGRLRLTDEEYLTELALDRHGDLPCAGGGRPKDERAATSR